MTPYSPVPQLGYFLSHRYWTNALGLLEYQLSLKATNKHFNTLSMFYYEGLDKSNKDLVKDETYFTNRIANNLLYGLEREFAIHSYPIPKSNLGLRKYRFFTYPMRIAYYAVGLYIVRLAQEVIQQYYHCHKHIHSNYGGRLTFDDQNNLHLTYDSVWYKPHYQRFRKRVRKEVSGDVQHKVVIHLDIQNYFEEIPVPVLLNFLAEYIKPSIQKEMRFDSITRGQIASFFDFIANGRSGIPQTDNDVVSSFIGHLYLIFGDLLIDQELRKDNSIIREHAIIRYMDDMYVSLTFCENVSRASKEVFISSLAPRIADCLYQRLSLRLNTKTKLFWLNSSEDKETLLRNLKRVSPGYDLADDDNKIDPNEKIKLIFRQFEKLKESSLDPTFNARGDLDEEILKEVYNNSVSQLFRKKENSTRIHDIFDGFNFDLVIAQPREILIVLLVDPAASERFKQFLLAKQNLTSRDVHLVLNYLCQTDFQSRELVDLLKGNEAMQRIMEIYSESVIATAKPGYFDLGDAQVLKIAAYPNVIEQIRLRVQSERRHEYSIALNHLLNEIHTICYKLDKQRIEEKQYEAPKVSEFLISKKVPHETCLKIRNLFDRRNKNPVSHADPIAWPVGQDEYSDYHKHVGICLKHIV